MLYFYLPGMFEKYMFNQYFIEIWKAKPEYFRKGIKIGAVYGCFPTTVWNGGRNELAATSKEIVQMVLKYFNDQHIPCRFTYTNNQLKECHLYDTFGNLCLTLAHNGLNEVLVNSELLEEYIRKNYPKYPIIASTTKCIKTTEQVLEALKRDYKLIVLDYNMNNTEELFNLPQKDKYELLVNAYCIDNCPNRERHYDYISKQQLEFSQNNWVCPNGAIHFKDLFGRKNFITVEDLYGKYADAGFKHFKLEGRTHNNVDLLESYLYYMVKSKYREEVRRLMVQRIEQSSKR